ncbi:Gamma-glutamyltranspeptidase [Hyalangium minutum]|uniref:Gamma-glutamyltranspeptidase n=1 Tax=Hyalangium minutum TaxID=394096 RepID=A0A085WJC2_9BACT|nr:Gamma-glutamyltranspeptidase [Hyalangium minutum]
MVVAALLMGSVACGRMEESGESMVTPSTAKQELTESNGLTVNGLTVNGLTVNGLTVNGLTVNGLTVNGLSSSAFASWFSRDVALNNMLMKYMVQCALPAGETRTYRELETGTAYTWEGSLGLAPGWVRGHDFSVEEQQLVSACLAAHVNKYGMHVPLSVLGLKAERQPIAYSQEELESFPRREACFFGNLFTGEGVFAGVDRDYLDASESSPRACGLTTQEGASESACSPMVHVEESCETLCMLDPSGLFYTECRYNGQKYRPLTTRIRSEDVFACGDGVCQFTESCGLNDTATSCFSDCGACE